MGLISSEQGNFVIGKLNEKAANARHIIYNDHEILTTLGFSCETADDGKGYTAEELADSGDEKLVDNCVNLYFEVDHDIFLNKGGIDPTIDFVTGMYNQVNMIYLNEEIESAISEIFIWDTPSPYSSSSSSGMLSQFQSFRTEFNGDLGQLLSYQASGGVAAGFNGICASNRAQSLSFSSINTSYNNFPTYSWNIMVISHEFGHIWGSRHTHACVWNGNNTAIDGCAGFVEGSCPLPGIPSQGGTIMSYCHIQSVGVNFNEGFGLQPGNVIRNRTENGTCLSECSTCDDGMQNGDEEGVDCGGSDCPACPTCDDGIQNGDEEGIDCGGSVCAPCDEVICENNGVRIEINFDLRAQHTSWEITNSAGAVVAAGGPYPEYAGQANVQFTQNVCLTDGCYTFTIFDSFGDGLCCRRGNGSYILYDYQTFAILGSGGEFTFSESTDFCLGNLDPSFNYCVQNGDEEGIDCGGILCPPCGADPTCDDGVQNGDEEGVDCGGSFCPPCASCNDGIQNGDEEGIDCGGSCPPCPTCDDGVQNGDEEGVDCGGSVCPPCETAECLVPTGLYVQFFANPTLVMVHWDAVAGANAYEVRYRPQGNSTWFNAVSTTNSRIISHLLPGATYEYQVRSLCSGGASQYSPSSFFTAGGNLREASPNGKGLDITNLFPNPTRNALQLTVESEETSEINLVVFDVLGRVVLNREEAILKGKNLISLDVSTFASGYHLIKIVQNDQQVIKKFIKE